MRITALDTHAVSAGWKNWLFVRVHTDTGLHGLGEATMNGFILTTQAAVHELEHFVVGADPCQVNALTARVLETVQDAGHIHRLAAGAIEVACWDILGKSLGVPVWQLLGGRHRSTVAAYANGWYRAERTPEAFVKAAEAVVACGFQALKLDPFGIARGFISEADLAVAEAILTALRQRFGPALRILIDVHARFAPGESLRIARRLAPLDLFWWEESTVPEPVALTNQVASQSPIAVATGEQFSQVASFATLAQGGHVSIFQPEPMSLGGLTNTIAVANIARAHGAWIAPHQSGGPVATAACLQLAACVPNFLIQEHFDPFNESWTRDLVTWTPRLDPTSGQLELPTAPGLGLDLNLEVAAAHPYDPQAYFDTTREGWEKRLGVRSAP